MDTCVASLSLYQPARTEPPPTAGGCADDAEAAPLSSYHLLLTLTRAELVDLRPSTPSALRRVIRTRGDAGEGGGDAGEVLWGCGGGGGGGGDGRVASCLDVPTLLQLELEGTSGGASTLSRTQLGVRLQATRMLCDPAFVLTVCRGAGAPLDLSVYHISPPFFLPPRRLLRFAL